MAKINLKQYGITGTTEVIYNPSYDELYREETRKGLRGYEKGQVTEMGAVNVMTGVYTGRSPKDKFFVMDETTKRYYLVDLARIQERQQTGDEEDLEGAEKDRCRRVVEQEALRRGHVLRSQREHPSEDPLHHGGRLAGAFREKHVHPPDGRGAGEVRRTRFRGAERLESQSQELQGTRTQLGNGGRVQPHRKKCR